VTKVTNAGKGGIMSSDIVKTRIEREFSYQVIIRETTLVVAIYIYHLIFPEAFKLLDYPFYLMMILVFLNLLIYIPIFFTVRRLKGDFEKNRERLMGLDKSLFFLNNYSIALLIPALGGQFINIFWFVTAINFCIIFASPYNSGRKMLLVYFAPLFSYIIHMAIYVFFGKGFHGIEGGFAILMCIVFFYTHLTINQKKLYDKMSGEGERLFDGFCDSFSLTERERDVLKEIFNGRQNKQIGEILFISSGTVRNHLSSIFVKTETHSRMELLSQFNNYY